MRQAMQGSLRVRGALSGIVGLVALWSCGDAGDDPPCLEGTLDCACFRNGTCDANLSCSVGTCVTAPAATGGAGQGGAPTTDSGGSQAASGASGTGTGGASDATGGSGASPGDGGASGAAVSAGGSDAGSANDGGSTPGGGDAGGMESSGGTIDDGGDPGQGGGGESAGGACAGVDCSELDGLCVVGACNPASGECDAVPNDGASCDDTHACTSDDACDAGVCSGALVCAEPQSVGLSGAIEATSLRGHVEGGELFSDSCPAGQALIGVLGELRSGANYLGRIQAVCGTLALEGEGVGPYSVTVGSGALLSLRGTVGGGGAFSGMCPANQVVVGFRGRSGDYTDQITLRCAPLTVTESASAFTIGVGVISEITPVGGAGGAEYAPSLCTSGKIATQAVIRAGSYVDAFGLGCQTLGLGF